MAQAFQPVDRFKHRLESLCHISRHRNDTGAARENERPCFALPLTLIDDIIRGDSRDSRAASGVFAFSSSGRPLRALDFFELRLERRIGHEFVEDQASDGAGGDGIGLVVDTGDDPIETDLCAANKQLVLF